MKAVATVPPFPPDGSVKTLGFGVIRWIQANLLQPDGDNAGEPVPADRRAAPLRLWWYAVDDSGRVHLPPRRPPPLEGLGEEAVRRRALPRRALRPGPLLALGRRRQARRQALTRCPGSSSPASPRPRPRTPSTRSARWPSDSDLEPDRGRPSGHRQDAHPRTRAAASSHPITASSSSQEGARPTFAVMDEPHHWTRATAAHALARVIRRNLAKVARAAAPGDDERARARPGLGRGGSYLAYVAISAKDARRVEGPPLRLPRGAVLTPEQLADEPTLREALRPPTATRPGSTSTALIGEIYDPSTPLRRSRAAST